MAIFNPFVGLRDIFSPTSPASIFRLGVVINKTDNTLTVRNSASGSVTKVFGAIPAIGDTIIFKDKQFLGIIGKDNTKIIDIE